mgnify:CR=1 FL=1
MNEIDAILSEDRTQKVIIFTEFVATQTYLQELLVNRGYTVTILNGGMSIDERNAAMQEFKVQYQYFYFDRCRWRRSELAVCQYYHQL